MRLLAVSPCRLLPCARTRRLLRKCSGKAPPTPPPGNRTLFYPHKFHTPHPILSLSEFVQRFEALVPRQSSPDDLVSVCGRVFSIRNASRALRFVDLHQQEVRLQIKAQLHHYRGDFHADLDALRRGDIVGITGFPARTASGELSVVPHSVQMLTPCLRHLPSGVLGSNGLRYRRRHLDLMLNPLARGVFRQRAAVITALRHFLDERGFLEVETPVLSATVGGASAKPFITRHNQLDAELFLRIAPELYLKQLVIAGFDRVYELGKQFRNEGVDATHNPEFTSCEFYMAYADYFDLMDMSEELLASIQARAAGQSVPLSGKVWKNALLRPQDEDAAAGRRVDFASRPYQRICFMDALESCVGRRLPTPEDIHEEFMASRKNGDVQKYLESLCTSAGIPLSANRSLAKLLDKLFSAMVERGLEQPTLVTDQPLCMSPLAKPHRSKPGLAERFELFANGMELVNAYTELNDPQQQLDMLLKQQGVVDGGYIAALEYGLPPTAGWGLGVDRLVACLAAQSSIRQVILFPAVKGSGPADQADGEQELE